ncbi:Copper transporter 2 [Arabidopsis thaliana]|uniref:Copper transporter 2 n=5 Tax=Arabidopsis TaxID=3701 RepID=COPT2_ARATH|nr:copper transporter 2 [Arabidopsis thaliana]Q9STG2.1 RecName: Full=Copper transporter 2; Short=AtCOPT2 [Arabidopsis thaliana]KAG7627583.1 Ctr copper transporter [Arabidopsis thaliana x Arabidopsis arenosa]KAG7633532.1 Ctr copper transporter [Arabidopsis suecica]AAL74262.1 copper transporter COPT2 [Arabidopsis thaliana]AAP88342.1 At3g46900 [Arabidopsis thaliana]AEE78216.1 copper transporter 2 [Arabidopsis thaliana]|eukprot:NP_190274.1 copper transporter 2 [Arabidopsis thaliana]
MDHDHMHDMPPPSPSSSSMSNHTTPHMMMMHMTFFWGKNTEVLFSGWPGTSSGMYALCLIVIFLLAVIAEWLAHSPILRVSGSTNRAAGLAQTAVYTLKTGLSYLVMLAVMSFNAGVFIVAIAGYGVGFFLFGSTTFKKPSDDQKTAELLPPSSGCVC